MSRVAELAQRALEHRVGDRTTAHRLGIRVRGTRPQHALDQPLHAAARERLQAAGGLGVARGERCEHRLGHGRAERRRVALLLGRGAGAPQLVRRGRLTRRPRHLGQQPAAAPLPQLGGEQRPHVVDERRRLHRVAFLVGRAERQEQDLLRPRDRRVEQVALAREHVLAAFEHEPARLREADPRRIVEERLRLGVQREHALLQPAHEHRTEPPRPDRQRVRHQHRALHRPLAHGHPGERFEQLVGRPGERGIVGRQLAQILGGGAQRRGRAARRTRPRARAPPRRAGAARSRWRRPPRRARRETPPAPRPPPWRVRRALPRLRGSDAARLAGSRDLVAAHMSVECVGEVRVGEPAGRAQPRQQVRGSASRQRRTRRRHHARAQTRVAQLRPAVEADRHAVRLEHLREHLGGRDAAAHEHRDVLRQHPVAHQLEHLGGDELGLGALAARLQQPHRAVRRRPAARRARTAAARDGAARHARPARSAPSGRAGARGGRPAA